MYEKYLDTYKKPNYPKRAVITCGMPNGNKALHVGHLGAVFIWADVFARFMRSAIGDENVLFISGTDGYGSPIEEKHRTMCQSGEFSGALDEFVRKNHNDQRRVLEKYRISLDDFSASCLGEAAELHRETSNEFLARFINNSHAKLSATSQFYDETLSKFLNGRQVYGKCPIEGCKSEFGYADECALGHQYMPSELINPVSTISGTKPSLRPAQNWYFDLEASSELLHEWREHCKSQPSSREFMIKIISDYLKPPVLYVREDYYDELIELKGELPDCEVIKPPRGKLLTVEFGSVDDRDKAVQLLAGRAIPFRTGKTAVPLRLTGDVDWGVKVDEEFIPESSGIKSFWVWPESLWAPISFTREALEKRGGDWRDWWCDSDSKIYQFIGEDNIYFYAIAEPAMFAAYSEGEEIKLRLPNIIANKHIHINNQKASSNTANAAPTAEKLLDFYTVEQLRMHFIGQGLESGTSSFTLSAQSGKKGDPIMREGNLLTNVLNRLLRSVMYMLQSDFDGKIPVGEVSEHVVERSFKTICDYESHMLAASLHNIFNDLDTYIREANKDWAAAVNFAGEVTMESKRQILIDNLHTIRVATTLIRPIVPDGAELVRRHMRLPEDIWLWERIFDSIYDFMKSPAEHRFEFLPPKTDFFKKLPSQY